MADFPPPQAATGTAGQPPVTAALIVYALLGISAIATIVSSGLLSPPLLSIIAVIGVIVAYVKTSDAQGTWVASHLRWLIRTFWWSLLWMVLGAILFVLIIGIPFALLLWAATSIWVAYRVVRGYLWFKDSQPVPGM